MRPRRTLLALVFAALLCPLTLRAEILHDAHLMSDALYPGGDPVFAKYLIYSNHPSQTTQAEKLHDDGTPIYRVTYTVDALRRRQNPFNAKNSGDRQLLFLGCSVTFGEGLMDDQTIPAQMARLTHRTQTFNYGTSGYGPGHVLSYLRYFDLAKQYPDPSKISLIYIWGDHLLERSTGAFTHLAWGGATAPYYSPEAGHLEFRGKMADHFPLKSFLARNVSKIPYIGSRVMRYLSLRNIDKTETQADIDLNLEILREAYAEYRRQFKNDRFYVVLYPFSHLSREKMKEPLEQSGIKVIDFSKDFTVGEQPAIMIKDDGHPSSFGAERIAKKLVSALDLK